MRWSIIRPVLLFVLWASVLTVSLSAAVRGPDVFGPRGPTVATLVKATGDVQIRDNGSPLWLDAARRQELTNGTIIATGERAKATISFKAGHEITLDENSQVVISQSQIQGDNDAIVSLVKGNMKTRATASSHLPFAAKPRLIVKAGAKQIVLSGIEDRATIQRAPGAEAPVVLVVAGTPTISDSASAAEKILASTPPADVGPTTLPPPDPVYAAPHLVTPATEVTYWTTLSLKGGTSGPPLAIALAPLAKGTPGLPIVEVSQNGRLVATLRSRLDASHGTYFAALDVRKPGGPGSLTLRPMLALDGDAKAKIDPAPAVTVHLASLADFPANRPLTVALTGLRFANGDGWTLQPPGFERQDAFSSLHLTSGRDLPRLASLLRGADGFAFQEAAVSPLGTALQLVRDHRLVATLTGVEPTASAFQRLKLDLGANLAFKGPIGSYHAALPQDLGSTTGITIVTNGLQIAEIHPALLRQSASASSLVASVAQHVFTARPTILSPVVHPARYGGDAPALATWASSVKRPPYLRRFAFVESVAKTGSPVFLKLNAPAFNALGLVEAANPTQLGFAYQLNNASSAAVSKIAGTGPLSPAEFIQRVLDVADAEAVVFAPPTGDWLIAIVADGKAQTVATSKAPPSRLDAAQIHQWLVKALGNDGVALARSGSYLLAAGVRAKLIVGRQALVGSSTIVEIVAADGDLCVLRVLLEKNNALLAPGAKISFE